MKCRKCHQKAAINMRQHKLALCPEHFIEWVQGQTARFIKKYRMFTPYERVLVAVSGGKDSLALWDILLALGYQADGLYIGLGIDGGIGYSDESLRCVREFVAQHGAATGQQLTLHVVDVAKVYGAPIPVAAASVTRGQDKPCSVCGLNKRHIMNRIARDNGYDVLTTGHNLDDEAATLLGNTLQWEVNYLRRQGPVLPESANGLARKVKPLCRFYEREMAAYALLRGIEYIYDECPFAAGATSIRYKELLNDLERTSPGAKLRFYLRFLHAREEHGIFQSEADETARLSVCPTCGQPTTNDSQCSFCRLWDRVHARLKEQQTGQPAREEVATA
ncbi:MAG: adenine nucleotide alpha hydrolase family protein [Anaerolineae bacterium]|nr:adenine nucleotide alpha hydrolase family protein [Anaerolineae bacterium]